MPRLASMWPPALDHDQCAADLTDVGASEVQVHPLNKQPYAPLDSPRVDIQDGVIFLTYASLAASSDAGLSRLQQLVDWAGETPSLACGRETESRGLPSTRETSSPGACGMARHPQALAVRAATRQSSLGLRKRLCRPAADSLHELQGLCSPTGSFHLSLPP